jgi:hypothetical protein
MGELAKALQSPNRPAFQNLLQQCDAAVVQPFAAEMSAAGFQYLSLSVLRGCIE